MRNYTTPKFLCNAFYIENCHRSNFKSLFLQRSTANKYLWRPTITVILRKYPSNSMLCKLYVEPS
jgi:hypothetical protein